jgi:hypothetical protein
MPPGILPDETAVVGLDIAAAFDARLAFGNRHTFQSGIMDGEQGALATETLVSYLLHSCLFSSAKIRN